MLVAELELVGDLELLVDVVLFAAAVLVLAPTIELVSKELDSLSVERVMTDFRVVEVLLIGWGILPKFCSLRAAALVILGLGTAVAREGTLEVFLGTLGFWLGPDAFIDLLAMVVGLGNRVDGGGELGFRVEWYFFFEITCLMSC